MDRSCSNCGHFGVIDPETREVIAPDRRVLEAGWLVVGGAKQFAEPVCYENKADLHSELTKTTFEAFLSVIRKDRSDCPGFTKRHPGCGPKEHREMSILDKVEAKQDAWRAEDIKWRQDVEHSISRRHNFHVILQVLITIATVVVTLLAARLLPFFNVPNP